MADWFSYAPSDVLLFGPDVYWRLFALHNQSLWPLPLVALGTGVVILGGLTTRWRWRSQAIWLAIALAFVGSAHFIAVRYAPINWPMTHAAWLFVAQAMLIVAAMVAGALSLQNLAPGLARASGIGLLAYAVLVHPLVGLGFGRPLDQAEIMGLAPDPTALASLGLLLLVRPSPWRVALSMLPVTWCVVSAATLFGLGEPQGWILLTALGIWLVGIAADSKASN